MILLFPYNKGLIGIIEMTRPSDIPSEIWDILNEEIKKTFSRDSNRSFTDPVLEDINNKLKKCIVLNHKINTYASKLRSLTIKYIVDVDQDAHTSMSLVLDSLVNAAESSMINIDQFNLELNNILELVKSRVNFYKEALNGS